MVTKYLLNMAIYVLYMEAIELMNMIISLHDSFLENMKNIVSQQFLIFLILVANYWLKLVGTGNLKSPAKTMAIFPKKNR